MEVVELGDEALALLESRRIAREACDWSKADSIRQELSNLGWIVCDEAGGKTKLISKFSQQEEAKIADEKRKLEHLKKREEINKITRLKTSELKSSDCTDGSVDPFAHISSGRQRKQLRLRYRRQAKKFRCPEYASWLVSTFGLELLRGGSKGEEVDKSAQFNATDSSFHDQGHILDIAGGHGDLAWCLCVTHNIPTTVVDPLPLRLSAGKTQWLLKKTTEAASTLTGGDDNEYENDVIIENYLGDESINNEDVVSLEKAAEEEETVHVSPSETSQLSHDAQTKLKDTEKKVVGKKYRLLHEWEKEGLKLGHIVSDERAAWLDGKTLDKAIPGMVELRQLCNDTQSINEEEGDGVVESKSNNSKLQLESHSPKVSACIDKLKSILRLFDRQEVGGMLGLAQRRGFFDAEWVDADLVSAQNSSSNQLSSCFEGKGANSKANRLLSVWRTATAIVGMHTDEATEPMVDLSLKYRKPFAVVPCCVFPDANKHRLNPDGTMVRSLPDFVRYLVAKCPNLIKTAVLPIPPPANIVVYVTSYQPPLYFGINPKNVLPPKTSSLIEALLIKHASVISSQQSVSAVKSQAQSTNQNTPSLPPLLFTTCKDLDLLKHGHDRGDGDGDNGADDEDNMDDDDDEFVDITGTVVWDSLRIFWNILSQDRVTTTESQQDVVTDTTTVSPTTSVTALSSSSVGVDSSLVHGKRVLELGAGSGLLGIGCGLLGASEVYITDLKCHLPRINANIQLNHYALKAASLYYQQVMDDTATSGMAVQSSTPSINLLSNPGDGWSSTSLPLSAEVTSSLDNNGKNNNNGKDYGDDNKNGCMEDREDDTNDSLLYLKENLTIKAAELEWGCDLTSLPEASGLRSSCPSFDLVIACEVLHWPALDLFQEDTISTLARTVLETTKVGGMFLIGYRERDVSREASFFELLRSSNRFEDLLVIKPELLKESLNGEEQSGPMTVRLFKRCC